MYITELRGEVFFSAKSVFCKTHVFGSIEHAPYRVFMAF